MQNLVKILLFESVTGTDYTYSKGENDVPEPIAADLVRVGHARYLDERQKPENAASKQAASAEKRKK